MQRISSFSRSGLVFDVLDEGPLEGEVVVLLHGFPERGTTWRSVAPLLHVQGLRTLTAVSMPHTAAFVRAALGSNQALRSWYMLFFQLPYLPELTASLAPLKLRRSGMTDAEIDRFRAEIVAYGALSGGIAWYRALPFARPQTLRRRVSVPTTLVWSEGDVFVDRRGVTGARAWVDAPFELVEVPGANHWLPTQRPKEVAEAVLARTTTGAHPGR